MAAANRAAAAAANSAEAANARERALFLGSGAPEAPGGRAQAGGAAGAGAAAARARRRDAARSAGSKALAAFMAVVLAVGLMPLPAFGDDGSLRGVSFNGNLVAASESTTATVDADGNVTSTTTKTAVDSDGNVEAVTVGGEEVAALDAAASARGQSLMAGASGGKGTIADLQGHGSTDSGLSTSAIIEAAKAEREAGEAEAREQAEARAAFDEEDAAIDISGLNDEAFATQRVVVALGEGAQLQQRDLNNVASSGSNMYVLEYKNTDAAKRAYVRYTNYDGTAFVAPDSRVEASAGDDEGDDDADDEGDGEGGGEAAAGDTDAAGSADADATEAADDAPVADLGSLEGDREALEAEGGKRESEDATKPADDRAPVVALIDTAIPADAVDRWNEEHGSSAELVGRVSAIGEGQPDEVDGDSHGARMLEQILAADPDARVLSVEALDGTGYGSAATVYAALTLATAARADIYNMSFAGYAVEGNAAIEAGVEEARAAAEADGRDVALLAAAGNMGQDVRFFAPASYEGVQAVGALDGSKAPYDPSDLAAFRLASSNYGEGLVWAAGESTSYATATASGTLSAMGARAHSSGWVADLQATLLADYVPSEEADGQEDAGNQGSGADGGGGTDESDEDLALENGSTTNNASGDAVGNIGREIDEALNAGDMEDAVKNAGGLDRIISAIKSGGGVRAAATDANGYYVLSNKVTSLSGTSSTFTVNYLSSSQATAANTTNMTTGIVQAWTPNMKGAYEIKALGGGGGGGGSATYIGGAGGTATGLLGLTTSDKLYIGVGGGGRQRETTTSSLEGAWGGAPSSGWKTNTAIGTPGGATWVLTNNAAITSATADCDTWNLKSSDANAQYFVVVAGGGGAGGDDSGNFGGAGGAGGGVIGGSGTVRGSYTGNTAQYAGGQSPSSGKTYLFSESGRNTTSWDIYGGGGGWYSGGSRRAAPGFGGSGHVGAGSVTNSTNAVANYTTKNTAGTTIDVRGSMTQGSGGAGSYTGKATAGSCVITLKAFAFDLDYNADTTVYANATNVYSNSILTTAAGNITPPTRANYVFCGYYTGRNGTGALCYDSNGTIQKSNIQSLTASQTLYAKWTDYTVKYAAGSPAGSGSMSDSPQSSANSYTLPASGFAAPSGYRFAGWKVTGSGAVFQPGASVSKSTTGWVNDDGTAVGSDKAVTLVAQWERYTTYRTSEGADICSPGWQSSTLALSEADALKLSATAGYNSKFTLAPEGQVFAGWRGSDGKDYKPGDEIGASQLTLTAVYSGGGDARDAAAPAAAPAGGGYSASRGDSGASSRGAPRARELGRGARRARCAPGARGGPGAAGGGGRP